MKLDRTVQSRIQIWTWTNRWNFDFDFDLDGTALTRLAPWILGLNMLDLNSNVDLELDLTILIWS